MPFFTFRYLHFCKMEIENLFVCEWKKFGSINHLIGRSDFKDLFINSRLDY